MSDYNEHLITLAGGDDKTPTRLERIQARANEATVGPWHWDESYGDGADTGLALTNNEQAEIVGAYNHHCCSFRDDPQVEDHDAEFIANARDDVPYLLAKLAAIRALADAHGKIGFRVTANDIRATLDAEVNACNEARNTK